MGGGARALDEDLVRGHVLLPLVIAAANDLTAPQPTPPACPAARWRLGAWTRARRRGAVRTLRRHRRRRHADGGPAPDAESFAAAAQSWRLPVTPLRAPSGTAGVPGPGRPCGCDTPPLRPRPTARPGRPLAGVRVLDLTAMWAGPLATWLLAPPAPGDQDRGAMPDRRPGAARRARHRRPGPGALFVAP
ncbi:MAG: hypothetical protein R2755_04190 [Acidimicrobiales bacterium]